GSATLFRPGVFYECSSTVGLCRVVTCRRSRLIVLRLFGRRLTANLSELGSKWLCLQQAEKHSVWHRVLPESDNQKHHGRNRHAVFQASSNNLVDPEPRQRPANPHHHRNTDDALRNQVDRAQHIPGDAPPETMLKRETKPLANWQRTVPTTEEQNRR